MDNDPSTLAHVEIRHDVPAVSIEVQRFVLPHEIESDLPACSDLRLDLSLTPRVPQARLSFQRHWPAHRYVPPGRLFLVPPGETLRARSNAGTQQSAVCTLRPAAWRHAFGDDLACDHLLIWDKDKLEANLDVQSLTVQRLLGSLCDEARHPGFASAVMCEAIAVQILVELGRYFLAINEDTQVSTLPAWRLKLIDDRLRDASSIPKLTELADLCGVSVRHLTRGFRASRGCSIGAYIQSRQIGLASTLLKEGESVKAIAHRLGFASASSFSHAFRRATGASPRQYRDTQFSPAEIARMA